VDVAQRRESNDIGHQVQGWKRANVESRWVSEQYPFQGTGIPTTDSGAP
jgi:hypothetical protein